jgi:hypothetical protein
MVTTSQIQDVISNYLSHGDANKFVLEFSRLSYNIHQQGDPESIRLANQIECKLADVRAGLASRTDLLDFVGSLVNPFVANNFVSVICFQVPSQPLNFQTVLGTASRASVGFFGTSLATECGSKLLLQT